MTPDPEEGGPGQGPGGLGDNNSTSLDAKGLRRALTTLADAGNQSLATKLERLFTVIATEASRSPRFARDLTQAILEETVVSPRSPSRSNRRAPGPFDPFVIFAGGGSDALRTRLDQLSLEQLRDIVAEHGMDTDRLAMRWKDRERVIGRILERVEARSAKGSAFRST